MTARKQMAVALSKLLLGAALLGITLTAQAQVQTRTDVTQAGPISHQITVERGTVVFVSGNNVVVRAEDGTLRHFDNVPESTTVTVDGKQLNVHQLVPGMNIERQTIVTTTPKMITTIKTVTGTVWHVIPPNSVILTLENGKNQRFTIPKGQKFTINGRETDALGLRKGSKIDAQEVTEVPETEVAVQVKRTGALPPPPPAAPKPDVPILIVFVPAPARQAPVETAAAAPAEPAPTTLPKTGSYFPLFGLLGALSIAMGLGLRTVRTAKS